MDISTIKESWLLASMKQWIYDQVAEDQDWSSIHNLLWVDQETLENLSNSLTQIPAALAVSRMDVYNVLRRSLICKSQLQSECIASLQAWAERIIADGGWAFLADDILNLKTNQKSAWSMCFSTWWQRASLQRYGEKIVCMDSTHNTCTGRTAKEIVFLYTVVARNQVTGKGVPLAFLLTTVESQLPISNFLRHLQQQEQFQPHFIMIDCSETKAAAIEHTMGPQTSIIYCHWHFLKAVVSASKHKIKADTSIKAQEQCQKAVEGVKMLMRVETKEQHDQLWQAYQREWSSEETWIKYIKEQWEHHSKRWAQAWWNQPHDGIDTNNYIEQWHEELKHQYLKSLQKQQADYLVSLLFTTVVHHYQQQEKAVELGLASRILNKAEQKPRLEAEKKHPWEQAEMVRQSKGFLEVWSWHNKDQWYTVHLHTTDEARDSKSCTCMFFMQEERMCKHMWLLFLDRANPPQDGSMHRNRNMVRTDPLMIELMQEDHDNHSNSVNQQVRECKETALKVLLLFSQAEKNFGKFEAAQLADLQASLSNIYHAANIHLHRLSASKKQLG